MITLFRIVVVLLGLMALAGRYLRTLGDFVVLGVFLFYALAASFVLAGAMIILVLAARWWIRRPAVPAKRRRSFWS